jgi:AcrR family transcriptional regulator
LPGNSANSENALKQARKQKILDAAETLFVERGLKGVTMELIANTARISKVTLYGYFPDKDSAFKAVATRFAEKLQTAFAHALEFDEPLAVRITKAVISKHELVFRTVRHSVHAADLFAAKDRVVSEEFTKLDRGLEKKIADAIYQERGDRRQATSLARIIFAGAQGIANHGTSLKSVASDIQILVQGLLREAPLGGRLTRS